MSNFPIYVTKSYSPPIEEYQGFVAQILTSCQYTNNGPLLQELEFKLKQYFHVDYCQFVTNGTVALQLALRAFGITEGEVITTPFSYVATTSAILWEHCTPVFADIDPVTFCLDPNKIEAAITPKTRAILPVHVFGIPCDADAIADIGKRYGIPVIYDAAHAFGSRFHGKSLLDFGDIATCSFHATKLFHTVEGGCVICHDNEINHKIDLLKRFGHNQDIYYQLGINAKASEMQAAMGLCNLPHIEEIIADRKKTSELYDALLPKTLQRLDKPQNLEYNYSYYPVVFRSEEELLATDQALQAEDIHFRRYFYPSLNTLPYLSETQSCPISEDISRRIACLPLYYGLKSEVVEEIVSLLAEKGPDI